MIKDENFLEQFSSFFVNNEVNKRKLPYLIKPAMLAWIVFIALLSVACSPGLFSETVPAKTLTGDLVTWERTGGIAGICQKLVIENDQSYTAEDCNQHEKLEQGQLSEKDWSQIDDWRQEYQAFDWKIALPPGSADMFNDSYHFFGSGTQLPSLAEQEEMNIYLADLFTRLSSRN